ncbi:Retrovirus-related Pol polyprotein from transposon RE1 [Linum grandiflorum]
MVKQFTALEDNGTWELTSLPRGKRVVSCKWVYKIKYKPTGEVERYKARFVAREKSKPSSFPLEQRHNLDRASQQPDEDTGRFRGTIGRLLYLTITPPDIQYAVNYLCQFVESPKQEHLDALKRVLRYKSAPGQGLHFPSNNSLVIEAYCDADWGGCALTRRSTTEYFIKLGDSPIAWRTKKQQVVSRSLAEAEYRAMATTVSEVAWFGHLLKEFGVDVTEGTHMYCDNHAALHIASNPVFHERMKHVEMDCHFVRERVISKEIKPHKISTKDQLTDLFTKALGHDRLHYLLGKLGVHDLHAPA